MEYKKCLNQVWTMNGAHMTILLLLLHDQGKIPINYSFHTPAQAFSLLEIHKTGPLQKYWRTELLQHWAKNVDHTHTYCFYAAGSHSLM